jgi:hypothetical protein
MTIDRQIALDALESFVPPREDMILVRDKVILLIQQSHDFMIFNGSPDLDYMTQLEVQVLEDSLYNFSRQPRNLRSDKSGHAEQFFTEVFDFRIGKFCST